MALAEKLLTAEEYGRLPDNGRPTELVRGRIAELQMSPPRHGQICGKVNRLLGNFAEKKKLGHVLTNDAGVVTERGPDTIRGADISFYSYDDVPPGPFPKGYLDKLPRLVVEVMSETDRWKNVLRKVSEYLEAGVPIVCVLEPDTESMYIYYPDKPEEILTAEDNFSVPEVLPGFRVKVKRFFE